MNITNSYLKGVYDHTVEKNPNEPEYIKTIWGTGYILTIKEEK